MPGLDLGFRPSRNGLHFANTWPPGPTLRLGPLDPRWIGVGDAAQGLCGGMVFTARDLWEAAIEPPADTTPPPNGSRRFQSIVRRQVESLDWLRVPLRFYDLSAFRPLPGRPPRDRVTLEDEWPRARADLEAGDLAMLGLVRRADANPLRLGLNHQVLAWAFDETDREIRIGIYDPNWPDRDDVELVLARGADRRPGPFSQSTGEPLLALFRAPYARRDPAAWR